MHDKSCLKKRRHAYGKNRIVFGILMFIASALFAGQAMAIDLELFGKPLAFKGYVNQGFQFGTAGDHYDTKAGLQQVLTQAMLETEYYPTDRVTVFISTQLVKDWAYDIFECADNDDWEERRFDNSRDELRVLDDYEDVLKEARISWAPKGFNFRIGKQIIPWGRMDGVRIMDQINPRDTRRALADVQFETSIIPIWLVKAEWYPPEGLKPPFVDDLAIEFTFNPNADFIPDKTLSTGGAVHGIWAADAVADLVWNAASTVWKMRIEELITHHVTLDANGQIQTVHNGYEEPDQWRQEGWEYGLRITTTLADSTLLTLNYFKGVSNSPVFGPLFMPELGFYGSGLDLINSYDIDGLQRAHPHMVGHYPDQEFVGFTFDRDMEGLFINWLGGVSPLLRCEVQYEFDRSFNDSGTGFVSNSTLEKVIERDRLYWGIGADWKFKWYFLNPRKYFVFVPQFTHSRIFNYPRYEIRTKNTLDDEGDVVPIDYRPFITHPGGGKASKDEWSYSLRMSTKYYHDKIEPFAYFQRSVRDDVEWKHRGKVKSDIWLFRLTYQPNHIWMYRLQLFRASNDGFDAIDHKDNISFTVFYEF